MQSSPESSRVRRGTTLLLICLLVGPGLALRAETVGGPVSGTVRGATGQTPLAGVQVFAAQSNGPGVFASAPTTGSGGFELPDLPAGTYDLALGIDRGLYLVAQPLVVTPNEGQRLNLLVDDGRNADEDPGPGKAAKRGFRWNNPLTASFIVVGTALLVGVLVEQATDDEDFASQ